MMRRDDAHWGAGGARAPMKGARGRLELWGGLECTVARIGDGYRDQLAETGHRDRPDDIDRIAGLGIRTLRFPVLWETVSPGAPGEREWGWHDARLARMAALGVDPVVGLVHHGSGPSYTSMPDAGFAPGLAVHARAVAERYPHVRRYTPVNEPLTTARFSGLYGHWYPHGRDQATFLRCLVNECRATALAMRAIREVRADAELIQTEDLGKTFATPSLTWQADFENERRWLSFDLLCGRVDRHHPLHAELLRHGIGADELARMADEPCPPDVLGINHYLTSERYLDEEVEAYPPHLVGGNGRERYADAEAVRVPLDPADLGPRARLKEAWERYRIPIAVTEAHHGCSRDEQLRWLRDVWEAASSLRAEGADVRAVTVWALFGAVDWASLLTRRDGVYEPGAFDARADPPRPTAIARAAEGLAKRGRFDHPALDEAGWWQREERLYVLDASTGRPRLVPHPRRLMVLGDGALAHALRRVARWRGLPLVDPADRGSRDLGRRLDAERPWAVVLAGLAPAAWAEAGAAAAERGLPVLAFSSSCVFDGRRERAFAEGDAPCPAGRAGLAFASAEGALTAAHPGALIVRAGLLLGPWREDDDVRPALDAVARARAAPEGDERLLAVSYLPDLAHAALDLLVDGEVGVRHLSNEGAMAWTDLLERLAREAGLPEPRFIAAPPPLDAGGALAATRGAVMPRLDGALDRFVAEAPDLRRSLPPSSPRAAERAGRGREDR